MKLSLIQYAIADSFGDNEKSAFFAITNFKPRRLKVKLKLRDLNEKRDISHLSPGISVRDSKSVSNFFF